MPLKTPISTKWRGSGSFDGAKVRSGRAGEPNERLRRLPDRAPGRARSLALSLGTAALVALSATLGLAAAPASAAPLPFVAPEDTAAVNTALERLYRMEYPAAEEFLLKTLPAASPARAYFAGIVCLNRFLDWGDTAALTRAEAHWELLARESGTGAAASSTARARLYRGLAGVQLSYTASLRGQNLRAARLALAAERQLRPLPAPEAKAARMLYDYYRGRLLDRLPFVGAAPLDAAAFAALARESSVLREMFLVSLFWIHVDQGRFGAADAIARGFLAKYPDNRLGRQMRTDGLFRAGRFDDALAEQEKLRQEYAALPRAGRLPLGYYKAVGSLARLHAALGQDKQAREHLDEWNRAGAAGMAPWLPPTLKRDLRQLSERYDR